MAAVTQVLACPCKQVTQVLACPCKQEWRSGGEAEETAGGADRAHPSRVATARGK